MIETIHLRIIQALKRKGTLTEAAQTLHLTQPALTHQIRALEQRLGLRLWQREGRRLRLTEAGETLLDTADHVLPVLQQAQRNLKALAEGRRGVLRIGVECFPCYQWLTGVIGDFLERLPEVDIDIVNRFRFTGLAGLAHRHIDLLVTPDIQAHEGIVFEKLADYRQVLLCAAGSPLARREHVEAEDLAGQTLLRFPVPVERLDVFTRFLLPAGQSPAVSKEIESLELMLQLVALGRGVCVLPAWLARQQADPQRVKLLDLGKQGLRSTLYLGLREQDAELGHLRAFVDLGRERATRAFAD